MPELPPLLDWAAAKLEVRVTPQPLSDHKAIDAFWVDLSRYRLRLSERTPCLALPAALTENATPAELKRLLDDIIISQKWQLRNVLVLAGAETEELRLLCRRDPHPLIALNHATQARIMQDGSQALIEEISRQTHISALAPYETSRPVTGEQFFGREHELRNIVGNDNTSFLIMGNRRMGKTSLMREAIRRLRRAADTADSIHYFDCTAFNDKLALYADIVRALAPREVERVFKDKTFSVASFLQRMARLRHEKIVLCLDEIDHLIKWDARDEWSALSMLRAASSLSTGSSEDHPIRVLMAGFRVAQETANNREAPLFNFASTIRVQAFDFKDTELMLVEPMLNLGVNFVDRSGIAQRIYRETGGQPNLVQYYCQFVVRHLEANDSRTLTHAVLDDALKDDEIRRRTVDELLANAENLEQLVVFCFLAHGWQQDHDRFTLAQMDGWLTAHGAELPRDDMGKALSALVTSAVLARDGRTFGFTFAALPRMLNESTDPEYQIKKILQEGL